jgi:2-keto-3-deoxy-6-phosphogluconate aldolase
VIDLGRQTEKRVLQHHARVVPGHMGELKTAQIAELEPLGISEKDTEDVLLAIKTAFEAGAMDHLVIPPEVIADLKAALHEGGIPYVLTTDHNPYIVAAALLNEFDAVKSFPCAIIGAHEGRCRMLIFATGEPNDEQAAFVRKGVEAIGLPFSPHDIYAQAAAFEKQVEQILMAHGQIIGETARAFRKARH